MGSSAFATTVKFRFSLIKSLYLNLKLFPFSEAVKLPVFVSRYTKIRGKFGKGSFQIKGKKSTGMILLGFGGSKDLYDYNSRKNYFEINNGGKLIFNGKARFSPHFSILVSGGEMEIGHGFTCNNSCSFSCTSGIKIGSDCLFGGNIVVRDSDGHSIFSLEDDGGRKLHEPKKAVSIGDHVWVCNKCDILKGVSIASNNIVAYGSLCTRSVCEENCVIAGQPAKIIQEGICWER